jgi:hypothetical protein
LVSISAKYSISEYVDDFFFTSSKYSHHEYFTLHQKKLIMNILQSLISNSLFGSSFEDDLSNGIFALKGHCVTFPQDITQMCDELPHRKEKVIANNIFIL